jgi:sulfate adenylyltransferase subunit 1
MLRIPHVIVAVNKMDLVDFSDVRYGEIVDDYRDVAGQLGLNDITFFPICALAGDNIVDPSARMPWYTGKPLLEFLEELEISQDVDLKHPRFQVQYVLRPQSPELHDYRGYAGRISSGIYRKGDPVMVLPANIPSTISRIEIAGKEVEEAFAPQSVVMHLSDDVDVSRGDMIARTDDLPQQSAEVEVLLCWLDEKPLTEGNKYLLQHNSRLLRAVIRKIEYRVDVNTLSKSEINGPVRLNEVVKARIRTSSPLVFDAYDTLRTNGNAILIDETGNSTVAAVMFS